MAYSWRFRGIGPVRGRTVTSGLSLLSSGGDGEQAQRNDGVAQAASSELYSACCGLGAPAHTTHAHAAVCRFGHVLSLPARRRARLFPEVCLWRRRGMCSSLSLVRRISVARRGLVHLCRLWWRIAKTYSRREYCRQRGGTSREEGACSGECRAFVASISMGGGVKWAYSARVIAIIM